MPFTDKQLSEYKKNSISPIALALIARLEAAERALWSRSYSDSVMEQDADYQIWLISAGKKTDLRKKEQYGTKRRRRKSA